MMAQKVLIGNAVYEITGGKVLIGGKKYNIVSGKTLVNGKVMLIDFSGGATIPVYISGSTSISGYTFPGVVINGVEYKSGDGSQAATVRPGDKITTEGVLAVNGVSISDGVYTVESGTVEISISLGAGPGYSVIQITTS